MQVAELTEAGKKEQDKRKKITQSSRGETRQGKADGRNLSTNLEGDWQIRCLPQHRAWNDESAW
jgi:hypothetical protein